MCFPYYFLRAITSTCTRLIIVPIRPVQKVYICNLFVSKFLRVIGKRIP